MAEPTEDTSGYSPLLAQMLKVDPNTMSSVSLSALGRQALGADTETYKAAKAQVDEARKVMSDALTNRKSRIDPSMLALAQGFLAPTRTGSFGESLGTAIGGYSKAQDAEADRAAQLAKMRYELANAALGEEKEAAKLGLSVVSKLSPKMTAYQQQVRSEGVDPNSPEGITRVKELLASDKATPDMKTFAAQAGISITDPAFAPKYKLFEETKSLRDIAARMSLNLNDPAQLAQAQKQAQRDVIQKDNPELHKVLQRFGGDALNPADLARAQRELQTDNFRVQNPDLAKALQRFGGDPLNPADLARGQRELQTDVNLDRATKNVSMAAQQAQTVRVRQEIDEHIRAGDFNAVAGKAVDVGVPLDPKAAYRGLNKIETAKKREEDAKEANKYINDKVAPLVSGIDDDITDLRRALKLNSEISTGFGYGVGFGIGEGAKLLSGDRAKINEFDSLAAKAAKMNRIPGDSNVSNADMKWMALGTFSSDKEPQTNKNILEFSLAQRQRDKDYNNYLQNYAAVNGAITPYAQAQWRKYLEANPITIRNDKGSVQLNPSRVSYQQYFAMPRVKVDAQGRETR